MKNYNADELIRKYLEGHCTAEEKALVESWYLKELSESSHFPSEEQVEAVHQRMQQALAQHIRASRRRPVTRQLWFRVAAAAVVTGMLATFVFLYFISPVGTKTVTGVPPAIQPGRDGAVLTLADGRQVVLDSLDNGLLTTQNGTKLLLNDGQLTYQANDAIVSTIVYNTISTTRGRQFRVILPDRSQVWLNAASSIRYPTAFAGNERKVELTGEAYFEISHDAAKPFIVDISRAGGRKGSVEVLGTHFNINAYDDEDAVGTTLLEGKVKVSSMVNGEWSIIKPGEQAIISARDHSTAPTGKYSQLTIDHSPDIDQVMAWKNGVFNFQDATLEKVMRQLARWYDIEIKYEQGIPDIIFEGEMSRQNELADVLHSLEGLGVHFRLEGRRLIVLP